MNIYKINHFASSITVFIPLIFFTAYQRQQLFHFTAAHGYKGIMFLYVHLPDIFTRHSSFFIQEADNIYLVQLILFPLPIYKVAHRGLAGLGSVSGNSYVSMSSEMYSGTRSSACRTRYAFPDASQRAVRPLRCV